MPLGSMERAVFSLPSRTIHSFSLFGWPCSQWCRPRSVRVSCSHRRSSIVAPIHHACVHAHVRCTGGSVAVRAVADGHGDERVTVAACPATRPAVGAVGRQHREAHQARCIQAAAQATGGAQLRSAQAATAEWIFAAHGLQPTAHKRAQGALRGAVGQFTRTHSASDTSVHTCGSYVQMHCDEKEGPRGMQSQPQGAIRWARHRLALLVHDVATRQLACAHGSLVGLCLHHASLSRA